MKTGRLTENEYAAFERAVVSFIWSGMADDGGKGLAGQVSQLNQEQKTRFRQSVNDQLPQSASAYGGDVGAILMVSSVVAIVIAAAEYMRTLDFYRARNTGLVFGAITFFGYSHYQHVQTKKAVDARVRRAEKFLRK